MATAEVHARQGGQEVSVDSRGGKFFIAEEGPSFWQPVPANGFVRCLLNGAQLGTTTPFSMGTQTVAPGGCYVREHAHDRSEEVIFFYAGSGGAVVIDDIEYPVKPQTAVYLGVDCRHKFVNHGTDDLTFTWFLMPGGIEEFFESVGRVRSPGDPTPEPFARPENVAEIEPRTVFSTGVQSMKKE
jgi:mannose-6-phosphate isomerase-like protein (cupin superfamily)